jgi:hypothetical protein
MACRLEIEERRAVYVVMNSESADESMGIRKSPCKRGDLGTAEGGGREMSSSSGERRVA